MIAASNLRKSFGDRSVLEGLTFSLPAGEALALIGSNGAGKTTTIRILGGMLRPDSGTAAVAGRDVMSDPPAARRLVGYLPESVTIEDGVTVAEYLEFHAGLNGVPRRQRGPAARALLEMAGLVERADDRACRLSRGLMQRLGIARSMVNDPPVLLLDEPFSGLDPRGQADVKVLVKELAGMGKTVLVSSHNLSELEETCSWVGLIEGGVMKSFQPLADLWMRAAGRRRLRLDLHPEADLQAALAACAGHEGLESAFLDRFSIDLVVGPGFSDHELISKLVAQGVKVRGLAEVSEGLSGWFLRSSSEAGT